MADSRTILKMVKPLLRNRLGEVNLSYLIKIAIESPQILLEEELEQSVDVWNRKPRRRRRRRRIVV